MDEILLAALIGLSNAETMINLCRTFYERGMRTFRLKLGRNIQDALRILPTENIEKIEKIVFDLEKVKNILELQPLIAKQ